MFKNLFKKTIKVTFYMKSGNVIVLDRVDPGTTFTYYGNSITGISYWKQWSPKNKMFLGTLDLSQIEAVVSSK